MKSEYTDAKNICHSVEHIILDTHDATAKEQVVEELVFALTKKYKKIHA